MAAGKIRLLRFIITIHLVVFFAMCSVAFAISGDLSGNKYNSLSEEYYVLLFTPVVIKNVKSFTTEIVEIDFSDNNTFCLISDIWEQPACGSYDKKRGAVRSEGTTGLYYDEQFELMEIKYIFTNIPLSGIRKHFIFGIGERKFKFSKEDNNFSQRFFFMGRGI